jgi:hypothetical protein
MVDLLSSSFSNHLPAVFFTVTSVGAAYLSIYSNRDLLSYLEALLMVSLE